MLERIMQWARTIKRDTLALYLAIRDPRTPWYAKAFAAVVVAYALSPIDLIPDFIPVLGYLDDLVLLPLGLWVAMRLTPAEVLSDCRACGTEMSERPVSTGAGVAIVVLWIVAAALCGWLIYGALRG